MLRWQCCVPFVHRYAVFNEDGTLAELKVCEMNLQFKCYLTCTTGARGLKSNGVENYS